MCKGHIAGNSSQNLRLCGGKYIAIMDFPNIHLIIFYHIWFLWLLCLQNIFLFFPSNKFTSDLWQIMIIYWDFWTLDYAKVFPLKTPFFFWSCGSNNMKNKIGLNNHIPGNILVPQSTEKCRINAFLYRHIFTGP